ncbi:hypothetical protein VMCG_00857 [Cytospora schulzeri]|uniref:BZIP domain-containing protein n=1 Tax=Cytospora schulzeri TaxID=448051 RepID=A0A423X4S7_9PEZI|nr:hypothetical protein VMCG_00857 [Valsa malicola]
MNHADAMAASPSDPQTHIGVGRQAARSGTEKRKPIRRDPEKRRQQNIQAQKKYRAKLRKKLDDLEALAASVASGRGDVPAIAPEAVLPDDTTGQQSSPSHTLQQQGPCLALDRYIDTVSHRSPAVNIIDFESKLNADSTGLELSSWDPTTSIDPSHLIVDKYRENIEPCWVTDYVDCGCPARHVQVRWSGPPRHTTYQIVKIGPNFLTADPYMNSLRIERMCCVDAIWSNCLHIGLDRDKFCGEDAISPFSRPTKRAIDDVSNDSMVLTIQSIFKTLKPDLRPTREQIVINHSPWYDVLPFPTFRKNIIRSQHMIDDDDLFHDLMDGVMCWGGAGIGRMDRDCSTGHASTGTPWDSRSWEAKPWFLRKYWDLLGGEEGELVRQSEWWRNIRGDESDPLLDI